MSVTEFRDSMLISGVTVRPLSLYQDSRGWLGEIFREDELDPDLIPAMCYISVTRPGIGRGPHEHVDQVDLFCFPGPGRFQVWLWDNRSDSVTFGSRMILEAGEGCPAVIIVPPGVVHGYRNISDKDGYVINLPNALYRGKGRTQPVDEIRHEDDAASPFRME